MTNCKNCGAPLHGWKCDYCGTEYPELRDMQIIQIMPHEIETLSASCSVSPDILANYGNELPPSYYLKMLSENLSRGLMPYMDVETWYDYDTQIYRIGARVGVLRRK